MNQKPFEVYASCSDQITRPFMTCRQFDLDVISKNFIKGSRVRAINHNRRQLVVKLRFSINRFHFAKIDYFCIEVPTTCTFWILIKHNVRKHQLSLFGKTAEMFQSVHQLNAF